MIKGLSLECYGDWNEFTLLDDNFIDNASIKYQNYIQFHNFS